MTKYYIIILLTFGFAGYVSGQTATFNPMGDTEDVEVKITNLYAKIIVEGVSGKEIKITTETYEGLPEKAKGLKPLSATGPENTGIGLSIIQDGNLINISGATRKADGEYLIRLPKNMRLKIEMKSWQAEDVIIRNMTGEVEAVTQNGGLRFEDVTGPIVAHSLSSNIEVVFSEVNQTSPTSLTSTSGDIDISIPSDTRGDFKMSTISGEVFTDLDFKFENEEDMKRIAGGMNAEATLNGGGVEMLLKSVSGDIFIRKSK